MERERLKAGPGILGSLLGVTALGAILAACLACGPGRAVETAAVVELDVPCLAQAQTQSGPRVGDAVIPMGKAVGIKLFSDGVLVVGLSPVETAQGACCPGRDCGLRAGDVITHINGSEVDTVEEIQAVVKEQEGAALTIQALRDQHSVQLTASAAENQRGDYQLGVWLGLHGGDRNHDLLRSQNRRIRSPGAWDQRCGHRHAHAAGIRCDYGGQCV